MPAIRFAPVHATTRTLPPTVKTRPKAAALRRNARRNFSVQQVANSEKAEPAVPSPTARASQRTSASPPLCRDTFDGLLQRVQVPVVGASKEHLVALREQLLVGHADGGKALHLSEGERRCLPTGLKLERLQHPGSWNDVLGDLPPLLVNSAAWPDGRALRIVDTHNQAIRLYRPGQAERSVHQGDETLLPEPEDDEIILLRHEGHFSLIQRELENVISAVPRDGDCFFSCISLALGNKDRTASNLMLRSTLAEHIWNTREALDVVGAWESRLEDRPVIVAVTPKSAQATPPAQRSNAAPAREATAAQRTLRRSAFTAHGPFASAAPDPQAKLMHGIVRAYNQSMTAHLKTGPHGVSDLQHFHQQLKAQMCDDFSCGGAVDEHAHKVLDNALQSAFSVHAKRNEDAANRAPAAALPSRRTPQTEDRILRDLLPIIRQFHASQMATALGDDIHAPDTLRAIHDVNVRKLVGEIGAIQPWASDAAKQEVASELQKAFPAYEQTNRTKIERLHGAITKAMEQARFAYFSEIEDVLKKHPAGLQQDALRQTHDRIVKDLEAAFRTSILDIRKSEPVETHWHVITTYIDNYWSTCVVPANERALATPAPGLSPAEGTSAFRRTHVLI